MDKKLILIISFVNKASKCPALIAFGGVVGRKVSNLYI
tara:strand:+ start:168 stop:281 length:114 start_codon:yes stop_codon:yes gene_type:complete